MERPRPTVDDRETRLASDDRATQWSGPPPNRPSEPEVKPDPDQGKAKDRHRAPGDKILGGQFELIERLRGGTQAMAFRGRAINGMDVFIKITLPRGERVDFFAKQLVLKDRLLSIRHPNLQRCLAFDIDHGDLCEVYEFIVGHSLEVILAKGPLDASLLRQLIGDMTEGINALHRGAALMHRDLKPSNVLLSRAAGQPAFRIVDYGIVSQIDDGGLTQVAGTVKYSPPERMQRYIENSELSGTWDWWSLGSILQEAIDGKHPYEQLQALFPREYSAGVQKMRGEDATLQYLFDEIQLEGAMERYRMHAGMVEVTARNPAAQPLLPLLRGLLTYNRDRRWGYDQVVAFLSGASVPDYYSEQRRVDNEIQFEDQTGKTYRSVADYVTELAKNAADGDPGISNAHWERARKELANGVFLRHAVSLSNADLIARISLCIWVNPEDRHGPTWDRDLGTALALFTMAEGAITWANIHGIALNADYARYLAARLENQDDEISERQLRELLSDPFNVLLGKITPDVARPKLAETRRDIKSLREDVRRLAEKAETLKVRFPVEYIKDRPSFLVRLASTPTQDDIRVIESEYKGRLASTTNQALQTLYQTRKLSGLDPVDLKVLRLSLIFFRDNDYETIESVALQLKGLAGKLRLAEAFQRGSMRMYRPKLAWLAVLSCLWVIAAPYLGTWLAASNLSWAAVKVDAGKLPAALQYLMFFGPLLLGIAIAALCQLMYKATLADLVGLYSSDLATAAFPQQRAREYAAWFALDFPGEKPRTPGGRLKFINAKIKSLPGVEYAKFITRRALLPRSTLLMVVVLLSSLSPFMAPFVLRPWLPTATPAPYDWLRYLTGHKRLPEETFSYQATTTRRSSMLLSNGSKCFIPPGTRVLLQRPIAEPGLMDAQLPENLCPGSLSRLEKLWVKPLEKLHTEAPARPQADDLRRKPVPQPTSAPPTPELSRLPTALPVQALTGSVQSLSPEGWPVIDGRALHLRGILKIAPDQFDGFNAWLTANGRFLDCRPAPSGQYDCESIKRVSAAQTLLLNGAATATIDAPPEYRDFMHQAQQAKRGMWK